MNALIKGITMKTSAKILKVVLFVILSGFGQLAYSAETAESVCAKFDSPRKENCLAAFKAVPNKKALTYTLRFLQLNSSGLKDSSCVRPGKHIKKNPAKKGIQNTCSFVLNDLTSKYKGSPLRANAYFVDLCAPSGKGVVKSFYVNKGTGTAHANYADRSGAHTTNPGAYLTADQIVNFVPNTLSAGYRWLSKLFGGMIPSLRMVGLHSTNNDTADGKPMHVSPYKSSHGCPSISADSVGIMRKLAEKGPSLVMNYGPDQFHPEDSLTNCNAVPDGRSRGLGKHQPKTATRGSRGTLSHTHATRETHRGSKAVEQKATR